MSNQKTIRSVLVEVNGQEFGPIHELRVRGNGVTATETAEAGTLDLDFDSPYLTQRDWFINALTGDNKNDGKTRSTALRSHAELERRWGKGNILFPPYDQARFSRPCFVHIDSALPDEDLANIDVILGLGAELAYIGGADRVIRAGTFTGVTPRAEATNTPYSFADGTVPATYWGDQILGRVRITSGARLNAVAWVAKSLGASNFRSSEPAVCNPMSPTAEPEDFLPVEAVPVVPQVGDTYALETLRSIKFGTLNVRAIGIDDYSFTPCVSFGELEIRQLPTVVSGSPLIFAFYSCQLNYFSTSGPMGGGLLGTCYVYNCAARSVNVSGGQLLWEGGLVTDNNGVSASNFTVHAGSAVVQGDAFFQNAQLGGSNVFINAAGIFDTGANFNRAPDGAGVRTGPALGGPCAGTIRFGMYHHSSGPPRLWGAGNVTGVHAVFGGSFSYDPNYPITITGTESDFKVAKATTSRAWDEANGVYTPARANTWTNMATAINAGGLGGNAHNLAGDAHILRTTNP